jgi:hypothetical protein
MTANISPITIRMAYADDETALMRLAALDSSVVPRKPVLLAEVDGELRAALSLQTGSVIADPFHLTTDLVALLRTRAKSTPAPTRVPKPRYRLRLA